MKRQFKKGDKVRLISFSDPWITEAGLKLGETYTIENSYQLRVEPQISLTISDYLLDANCFELVQEKIKIEISFT